MIENDKGSDNAKRVWNELCRRNSVQIKDILDEIMQRESETSMNIFLVYVQVIRWARSCSVFQSWYMKVKSIQNSIFFMNLAKSSSIITEISYINLVG